MPAISIIVPVYKVEPYLAECVDSILAQTFRDFELILVDDGSPDRCPAMCDAYAEKDPRVRVIHKPNGGLSSARNAGLEAAEGEYISFIDSDDWIDPEMMEQMYTAAESENSQMVVCDVAIYDDNGVRCVYRTPGKIFRREQLTRSDYVELLATQYWGYVIACNKLYHRSVLAQWHYPEGYVNEDAYSIHHLVDRCDRISILDRQLYCYRQRTGSIMHSGKSIRNTDLLTALADRIRFSAQKNWENLREVTVLRYVHEFFDDYTGFVRDAKTELYFKRMEESLRVALPYVLKCPRVPFRHKVYVTLIRLSPRCLGGWIRSHENRKKSERGR